MNEVNESAPASYDTPPIDAQALSAWLAAWASGTANDQHTAYLDKIVKQKIAAADKPRGGIPPKVRMNAAVMDFVVYMRETSPVDARRFGGSAGIMAEVIAARVDAEVGRALTAERNAQPIQSTAPDAETHEQLSALDAQVDRLKVELDRAHEWRFHLEAHAREVHGTVLYLLEAAKRAPTKEELRGIVATLKEATGWAP